MTMTSGRQMFAQQLEMATTTIAELQQLLLDAAAANKATAEAGQANATRITKINTTLEKVALSQKEISTTSTCVESSMSRVIQDNMALD